MANDILEVVKFVKLRSFILELVQIIKFYSENNKNS